MQIKKIFKNLPITIMTACLALAAAPLFSTSSDNSATQNYLNTNFQTASVQTVSNVNDIKVEIKGFSPSAFAIVKDAVNGDRLYGWGGNWNGSLGIGATGQVNSPQLCKFVDLPPQATITAVYIGQNITAVVVNGSQLYLAGRNASAELGNGTIGGGDVLKFTKNNFVSGIGNFTHISMGYYHVLVVVNNQLYAWGLNSDGRIGIGNTDQVVTPQLVNIPSGTIKSVVATAINSYAWIDNKIYAWGSVAQGGLGIAGVPGMMITSPTPIDLTKISGTITGFSAGNTSTWASASFCHFFTDDNKLYGWGSNAFGVLGSSSISGNLTTPEEIVIPNLQALGKITKIFSAENFSAVQIGNDLYAAGSNQFGQLCQGMTNDVSDFTKIKNYIPNNTTEYSLFLRGGMAITDGIISIWGSNVSGSFGITTDNSTNTSPVVISGFGTPSTLTSKNISSDIVAFEALRAINPSGAIINRDELTKYVDGIDSFPDDTIFTVSGTPIANDAARTIELSILADKARSQPDGVEIVSGIYPLVINGFKQLDSKIVYNSPPPEKYSTANIQTLLKQTGGIANKTNLGEFIDLNYFPKDTIFSITADTVDINNKRYQGILNVNKHYAEGRESITTKAYPFTFENLIIVPDSTAIGKILYESNNKYSLNNIGTYLGTENVDMDNLSAVADLKNFPIDTHFTISGGTPDYAAGTYTFNLFPTTYHSHGFLVENTTGKTFEIVVKGLREFKDSIVTNVLITPTKYNRQNIKYYLTTDIHRESNIRELFTLIDFPPSADFSITNASVDLTTGKFSGTLNYTSYYKNGFWFDYGNQAIVIDNLFNQPDSVVIQNQNTKNIYLHEIMGLVKSDEGIVKREVLDQLFDLNSFPATASFTIADDAIVNQTYEGKLIASQYYEDGLINSSQKLVNFKISGFAIVNDSQVITKDAKNVSLEVIKDQLINNDGTVNKVVLDKLIDLKQFPDDTTFTIDDLIIDEKNKTGSFKLGADKHFANGIVENHAPFNQTVHFEFAVEMPTTDKNNYHELIIGLSIGGALLAIVLIGIFVTWCKMSLKYR